MELLDLPYGTPPRLEWPYQPDPFIQQTFGMPKLEEAHPGQGVAIVLNQEDPIQNEPHPPSRPARVAPVQPQQVQIERANPPPVQHLNNEPPVFRKS